ncbi:hypothetical protein CRG98_024286 [Punica granatum]|uniref:Uncharacterized protein n=1 Tax=Punica granatum TaxID=22663 RepID=A0A2I0JH78_PUNGR|nr:hypothetical protein CRG98_024286 [Punica granatum]
METKVAISLILQNIIKSSKPFAWSQGQNDDNGEPHDDYSVKEAKVLENSRKRECEEGIMGHSSVRSVARKLKTEAKCWTLKLSKWLRAEQGGST